MRSLLFLFALAIFTALSNAMVEKDDAKLIDPLPESREPGEGTMSKGKPGDEENDAKLVDPIPAEPIEPMEPADEEKTNKGDQLPPLAAQIMKPMDAKLGDVKLGAIYGGPRIQLTKCITNAGCAEGMTCSKDFYCELSRKSHNHLMCPGDDPPTTNVYCREDGDCEAGKCLKGYYMDETLADDDTAGQQKYVQEIGVCCSKKEYFPKVLKSCSIGYLPVRRAACGAGLKSCPKNTVCQYAKTWFGRCCAEEGSVETGRK